MQHSPLSDNQETQRGTGMAYAVALARLAALEKDYLAKRATWQEVNAARERVNALRSVPQQNLGGV